MKFVSSQSSQKATFYNTMLNIGIIFWVVWLFVDFMLPIIVLLENTQASEQTPTALHLWVCCTLALNTVAHYLRFSKFSASVSLANMQLNMLVQVVYFMWFALQTNLRFTWLFSWTQYCYIWYIIALDVSVMFNGL